MPLCCPYSTSSSTSVPQIPQWPTSHMTRSAPTPTLLPSLMIMDALPPLFALLMAILHPLSHGRYMQEPSLPLFLLLPSSASPSMSTFPIFTNLFTLSPPQLSGGAPLPSGAQETLEGEGLQLTWTRPLDFSDSGVYECVAVNEEGESTASVDMTVVCECGRE